MSRYRMSDGSIVDTDNASRSWDERTEFDGRNQVSVVTGDQWLHQTLYRSRKGRYYVEHSSQWQGAREHVEWVSNEEAARWLLQCGYNPGNPQFPEELEDLVDQVME